MKIQVKGNGLNLHENTTLNFSFTGVQIEVSLNIEPSLKKYLYSGNIYKGEKMYLYKLKKHIPGKNINAPTIQYVHDQLLKNCMMNIRKAKIEKLKKEVQFLSLN